MCTLVQDTILGASHTVKTVEHEDYEDVDTDNDYENDQVLLDDKVLCVESTEQTIFNNQEILSEGILDGSKSQIPINSHVDTPTHRASQDTCMPSDIEQTNNIDNIQHSNSQDTKLDYLQSSQLETVEYTNFDHEDNARTKIIETPSTKIPMEPECSDNPPKNSIKEELNSEALNQLEKAKHSENEVPATGKLHAGDKSLEHMIQKQISEEQNYVETSVPNESQEVDNDSGQGYEKKEIHEENVEVATKSKIVEDSMIDKDSMESAILSDSLADTVSSPEGKTP